MFNYQDKLRELSIILMCNTNDCLITFMLICTIRCIVFLITISLFIKMFVSRLVFMLLLPKLVVRRLCLVDEPWIQLIGTNLYLYF